MVKISQWPSKDPASSSDLSSDAEPAAKAEKTPKVKPAKVEQSQSGKLPIASKDTLERKKSGETKGKLPKAKSSAKDGLKKPKKSAAAKKVPSEAAKPPPAADLQTTAALEPEETSPRKEKLFKVGRFFMSARQITVTIELVERMEATVVASLKRAYEDQKTPGSFGTEEEKSRPHSELVEVEVPAPGGGTRTIMARSKGDNIDAVNERYLLQEEHAELLQLAQELPDGVMKTVKGNERPKPTAFKRALLKLLRSGEEVELYEIRTLLPVKESGTLNLNDYVENADGKRVKPEPEFTPTASEMLREHARKIGALKD